MASYDDEAFWPGGAIALLVLSVVFFVCGLIGWAFADTLNADYGNEVCREYSQDTGECVDSNTVGEIVEEWKSA